MTRFASSAGLRTKRGTALIFVVIVIAALVAIGFPFLISMRLAERSAQGFNASLKSRQLANAARSLAVVHLQRSHPDEERRAREARGDQRSDPEGADDLRELRIDVPRRLGGRYGAELNDPRGTQGFAEAVDLRGRLDPHTCGPLPLANLLGVTTLTSQPVLSYKERRRMFVAEPRRFFSDGDPTTWDGIVRVGNEFIAYKHRTDTALEGLLRGIYMSWPSNHGPGTPVHDARAWKIAADSIARPARSWRRYGGLARFETTSALRRIADWQFGAWRMEQVLIQLGPSFNAAKLRSWGLNKEEIADAGLDPTVLGRRTPDDELSPGLRLARAEAERALRKLDLPVKSIRRHHGEAALLWQARSLRSLSGRAQDLAADAHRARHKWLSKVRSIVKAPYRKWLVRQVRVLAKLRREAPHLETLGRLDLERLRPFLSTAAPTEGERWSAPLLVTSGATRTRVPYSKLIVADPRRFAPGRVVEVRPRDGRPPEYRVVTDVSDRTIQVTPALDFDYGRDQLEIRCRQPTPVNVRTASREVLVACLSGIQSKLGSKTRDGVQVGTPVSPDQAEAIAAALVEQPPATHAELRALLLRLRQARVLDDHAVDAVFRNAVDPANPTLITASVPFCYRSGDVYEIESTGIVNSPAGLEILKHGYRDTVIVAPPRTLTWHLDSQRDFTQRLFARRAGKPRPDKSPTWIATPLHLPGRWSHLVQTAPAYLGPEEPVAYGFPSRSHARGEGELRPQLWREPDWPPGSTEAPRYASELPPRPEPPVSSPPPPKTPPRVTPKGQIPRHIPGPVGTPRRPPRQGRTPPPPPGPPPLPEPGPGAPPVIRDRTAAAPRRSPPPASLARLQRRALPNGVYFTVAPDLGRDRFRAPGQAAPTGTSKPPPSFGGYRGRTTPVFYLGGGPRVGMLRNERWPERLAGAEPSEVKLTPEQISSRFYALEDSRARANLGPGTVRAWFRFDRLPPVGQRAYLFDGGKEIHLDRISLYLDGPQQLVLALHDEALDLLESGGKPRSSRVVYAPDQPFQEGNWYHVACFWKGTDRGDLALMVDGQLVGQETHGTRLAEAIDEYTNVIPLEDATAFPATGWVRIGQSRWQKGISTGDRGIANTPYDVTELCEVLRYVGKKGHSLILETGIPYPYKALPNRKPGAVRRWDPEEKKWVKTSQVPARETRRPRRGSGHPYEFIYAASSGGGAPAKIPARLGFAHDKGTFVVPYGYHTRVKNGPDGKQPEGGGTSVRRPQPANGGNGQPLPPPQATKKDIIRRGGARLRQPLVRHTPASVLYQPVPGFDGTGDIEPEVLSATATEIPLLAISADWPPMGIVRVTSRKSGNRSVERILYRKLNRAGRKLEGCVRGLEGTTAAAHHLFDPILLESITVSDASDYPSRESLAHGRVYVSLGGRRGTTLLPEWISIQRTQDKGLELLGLVLIPSVDSLDAEDGALPAYPYRADLALHMTQRGGDLGADPGGLPLLNPKPGDAGTFAQHLLKWEDFSAARAQKNTERPAAEHSANTRVIPTFAVRSQDAHESGRGDIVTVADDAEKATPQREEMTIAHTALSTASGQPHDRHDGWLIAFDDFTTRSYEGAKNARLARWPVGNLHSVPTLLFGRRVLPPEATDSGGGEGKLPCRVDDLVSMQLSEHVFAFPIPVDIAQGLSLREKEVDLGIYLVDQEVIAVTKKERKFRRHDLITMRRGVLGSTAADHSNETPGWRLDWPLVAVVDALPATRKGPIKLRAVRRHPQLLKVSPRDGYLALDRGKGDPYVEVRPYTRHDPTAWHTPLDRFGRRTFRSAFGSGRAELQPDDLLVDLPVRGHDRYGAQIDSLQGLFFQASREAWGARLVSVDWDEQLPNPYAEVKVAVRADAGPSWETVLTDVSLGTPGLYLFDDPRHKNRIGLRADQVTLRVYLTWKKQAFYRDAWKQPIRVGAVRLRYRQATRTLRREERVD